MGQYEEAAKRLKYTPFDHTMFGWYLVHDKGPLFFVLRDLLRKGNYVFAVTCDPLTVNHMSNVAIITPWSSRVDGEPTVLRVRGQPFPRLDMPLYYESGDWDVPQQNFLFDWTEDQAWGYLVHHGLIDIEDLT